MNLEEDLKPNFTILGKPKKYVLFISPINYFGVDGYKLWADTLKEAFWIIDTPEFDDMYIRLQCKRLNSDKGYWRVLLKPVSKEDGNREVEGSNDWELTDRIFGFNKKINLGVDRAK